MFIVQRSRFILQSTGKKRLKILSYKFKTVFCENLSLVRTLKCHFLPLCIKYGHTAWTGIVYVSDGKAPAGYLSLPPQGSILIKVKVMNIHSFLAFGKTV